LDVWTDGFRHQNTGVEVRRADAPGVSRSAEGVAGTGFLGNVKRRQAYDRLNECNWDVTPTIRRRLPGSVVKFMRAAVSPTNAHTVQAAALGGFRAAL
jgi:hypothetical protein